MLIFALVAFAFGIKPKISSWWLMSGPFHPNFYSRIFKIIFKIYLFLAVLGLCCCMGFSLIAVSRGYSSLHCTGFLLQGLVLLRRTGWRAPSFSSCGTWARQLPFLGSKAQAQQFWRMGWVAPWHLGSSWIKDHTWVSCIGWWILYHSHKGSPSSRIFMASGLMIKVFNPFWVNFGNGVRVFQFHSFACNRPAFTTPFLKRQSFPDAIISTFLS